MSGNSKLPVSRTLAIMGALIGLDAFTKHALQTPEWAFHRQGQGYFLVIGIALVIAATFMLFGLHFVGALLAVAAIGNGVSAAWGAVPNPFVIQSGDAAMAFNVADLAGVAGVALLLIFSVRMVRGV